MRCMVIYNNAKKLESTLKKGEVLDAKQWKPVKIHSTLVVRVQNTADICTVLILS